MATVLKCVDVVVETAAGAKPVFIRVCQTEYGHLTLTGITMSALV
jgi:hypothetical protein